MAVVYSDIKLFNGVRERDNRILNYIYKNFYPFIERFIKSNHGDEEEAQDVFQEALITIYRKLHEQEIDETGSFKAYLYAIARFIWLRKLKAGTIRKQYEEEVKASANVVNELSESYKINEKYRLFQKHFQKLNEFCKKILQLHMQKLSYSEIGKKLGYKDPEYIKTKKYKCKEMLIRNIKTDLEFKDIYLDDFMEI